MYNLYAFLNKLEERKIFFKLGRIRDSILIEIAVPGERWEVEFFEDGHVEVEKFLSDGTLWPEQELDHLFENFSD
jgi:hypothetical protein